MDIQPFSDYDLLPIYLRVADDLHSRLGTPGYEPGKFLPGEHELSQAYNLSRGTIRKALDVLASDGLFSRQPGRGTIILPPPDNSQHKRRRIAVLWSMVRWMSSEMLGSLEQHLTEVNAEMLFSTSQHRPEKEAELLSRYLHNHLDGLILYTTGYSGNQSLINTFAEKGVPLVLLDRFVPEYAKSHSWVTSDNETGAHALTHYLLSLGHQRIAFVAWTPDAATINTVNERKSGYLRAMTAAHLEPLMLLRCGAENDNANKLEFTNELLQFINTYQPTAIFFHNDASAYRLYAFFQECGIRIPEDISIAGFDGLELEFGFSPLDLTTVKQDFKRLGHEAATTLLKLIEQPQQQPIQVRIPVELYLGGTAAPPST